MALVQITDVFVPDPFLQYVQQFTETKSRLVQSGIAVRDATLDNLLAQGGLLFNLPSWQDLSNSDSVVVDDVVANTITPEKTTADTELGVRLSRAQAWSAADLVSALAGSDPMTAMAARVGAYWVREQQRIFIATMIGVFADNAAVPSGGDTHTQNDMTNDITGVFAPGTTDFSAEAFIDAVHTMGDSSQDLAALAVHSVVFARMQKNNLIDFVPDARGETVIPTFLGREVIVDDGLPVATQDYDTWIFGNGALRWGIGSPRVGAEVERFPDQGNGGGVETLFSRQEWMLHPTGHRYAGTAANGGPSNAATANNLGAAASWSRIWPERKQIKIARLITTEA